MGKRTGKPRGRPKGAANKITQERLRKVQEAAQWLEGMMPNAFEGDSHAFLMSVYKDPTNPLDVRLDAAKAAIGYEKPRLAAVEHSGNEDKPLAIEVVSGVTRIIDTLAHDSDSDGEPRPTH